MERGDFALIGCGGAGGNLVDTIAKQDARYAPYYLNTSITDIQSLETYDDIAENYYTISTRNGVGRDKIKGTAYAKQRVSNMLDIMLKLHQDTIYLVTSFSGGSGSSIVSVIIDEIAKLQGQFNKTINLIGILPSLKSTDKLLNNAKTTWNEIMDNKHKSCINSFIFIDNNVHIPNEENMNEEEKEIAINNEFASLFNRIFDIPIDNGTKFDVGNLGNILNDKGCLYIYDLPTDCTSFDVAMSKAESTSVLCKMFRTTKNTVVTEDKKTKFVCNYLGLSTASEQYSSDVMTAKFHNRKEMYVGNNVYEDNILLLSGCLPPVNTMKMIDDELKDRARHVITNDDDDDYTFKDTEPVIIENDNIDSTDNIQYQETTTIPQRTTRERVAQSTVVSPSRQVNDLFRRRPRK